MGKYLHKSMQSPKALVQVSSKGAVYRYSTRVQACSHTHTHSLNKQAEHTESHHECDVCRSEDH